MVLSVDALGQPLKHGMMYDTGLEVMNVQIDHNDLDNCVGSAKISIQFNVCLLACTIACLQIALVPCTCMVSMTWMNEQLVSNALCTLKSMQMATRMAVACQK